MPHYARDLRAIGQALEILRVERFDLEPEGETYLVHALTEPRGDQSAGGATDESTVRYIWDIAPSGAQRSEVESELVYATAKTLNLHYTPEDLARLAAEWQAKRNNPHGLTDPTNLSELLRTVGGYLGDKGVYLEKIRRYEKSFMIQYEDNSGQKHEEHLSEQDLQGLSARMFAKRGGRPAKVPALEEL
jgi:hypothetical protein